MLWWISDNNGPAPSNLPADPVVWRRVAIEPSGRRAPETPLAIEQAGADALLLDHAGPAAVTHLRERPLGAAETLCPQSDRRARALDDDAWRALPQTYATLAGPRVGLAVCEDNLLFSALSPIANPGVPLADRLARVLPVARALSGRELMVFLTIDEGCPGGLDLTAGIKVARAFIEAGARALVVGQGTARLPALLARARASTDPAPRFIETATWARANIDADVPIYARAYAGDPATLVDLAERANLAGVALS